MLRGLVEAVDAIDDWVDRVVGQETIHSGEMFDRSDGDTDDVGIFPLKARVVRASDRPLSKHQSERSCREATDRSDRS